LWGKTLIGAFALLFEHVCLIDRQIDIILSPSISIYDDDELETDVAWTLWVEL
jgi:hypothetical protein